MSRIELDLERKIAFARHEATRLRDVISNAQIKLLVFEQFLAEQGE